jgi:hypothetical protein
MDQQIDRQAVFVLAKLAALRAIKKQIQREGRLRVSLIPAGKLNALAGLYLKSHPELIAQAMQSDLVVVQQSKHSIKSRRPRNQGVLVCKNHERNGGAE